MVVYLLYMYSNIFEIMVQWDMVRLFNIMEQFIIVRLFVQNVKNVLYILEFIGIRINGMNIILRLFDIMVQYGEII